MVHHYPHTKRAKHLHQLKALFISGLSQGDEKKIKALNKGRGVLILTDMFGGTPSNISLAFLKEEKVEVLTGVNLPMVIAIAQNRSNLTLKELAEKAEEAGKMSISMEGKLLE